MFSNPAMEPHMVELCPSTTEKKIIKNKKNKVKEYLYIVIIRIKKIKIMNCLLMHTGWVDQSLCRHVINSAILPSTVTYPGLHLYSLSLRDM